MRLKARRDVENAIESGTPRGERAGAGDVVTSLEAFAAALSTGIRSLHSILGKNGVTFVKLEGPLRVRLRFRDKRVSLDADEERQPGVGRGLARDGDYQFDTGAETPALINLSQLSTEAGYGDALTPAQLLKAIAAEAELPRPAHLDEPGPLRF